VSEKKKSGFKKFQNPDSEEVKMKIAYFSAEVNR